MNRRLVLLIGTALVLGGIFAVTRLGGNETVRAVAPPQAGGPAAPAVTPVIAQEEGPFLPPLSSFPALESRPLFRPDRRPPAEPAISAPVEPPVAQPRNDRAPEIIVVSVVIGPEGRGAATVREDGETRRVYTGDTIGSWRVDAIRPDGIEVSSGRERWALPVGEPEE